MEESMAEDALLKPFNFLGFSGKESTFDRARFVVLPVPFEATTSYGKGTMFGPHAIIHASHQVEFYDEELERETWKRGIHTLPPFTADGSTAEFLRHLTDEVDRLIGRGKFVVTLGGEHSITEGPVKACARRYRNLSVLQIDAHADLRDAYDGTAYSHACAAQRLLDCASLVQVGIRNVSEDERKYINKGKVRTFFAHEGPVDDRLIGKILKHLTDNVYITIDLDGLDPSVIPAVGTPVPGGLGWYEALRLIRKTIAAKNVVGADVMELCPIPSSNMSDFAAARLVYKIMGYVALGEERTSKKPGSRTGKRKS